MTTTGPRTSVSARPAAFSAAASRDTLVALGRRFLADPRQWPQVQAFNRITNPRHMPVGMVLRHCAHQRADRGRVAERNERAVITVGIGQAGFALETTGERFCQQFSLLMCGLRAWRHERLARILRTGCAIAKRKDMRIARGLQGAFYDELVDLVGFKAVEPAHEIRDLDAGCPDHDLAVDQQAAGHFYALPRDFYDCFTGMDFNVHAL